MARLAEGESDKALWLSLAQSWVRLAEHVAHAREQAEANLQPEDHPAPDEHAAPEGWSGQGEGWPSGGETWQDQDEAGSEDYALASAVAPEAAEHDAAEQAATDQEARGGEADMPSQSFDEGLNALCEEGDEQTAAPPWPKQA